MLDSKEKSTGFFQRLLQFLSPARKVALPAQEDTIADDMRNTKASIDLLEEELENLSEAHQKLKKLYFKSVLDISNLEAALKAVVMTQSQLVLEIQTIYAYLQTKAETDMDLDLDSPDDSDKDGGLGGSGGMLN